MNAYVEEWDVRGTGTLAEVSRRFPDLTCSVRPLGFRWAIRCAGPPEALKELCAQGICDPTYLRLPDRPDSSVVFAYAPRGRETSVLREIAAADGFVLPPMRLSNGTLRLRFISRAGPRAVASPQRSDDWRLVSRRRLTASRLRDELERQAPGLPGLTARQTEVLLAAVRAGYYEVPRRTNVLEIARHLSLGRSTTEEHLRAAESALIRAAAPLVGLAEEGSKLGPSPEPLEHFARFSSELELYVDLALRGGKVAQVSFLTSDPGHGAGPVPPELKRILRHIRTGKDDLRDIPVELEVGPFERQVLDELRRIPSGQTRTYGEIAQRLGRPEASRAVGNACAHNPVPIVIPCHRVVPARGGIGRYSGGGGELTKRRLLSREGALSPDSSIETDKGESPVPSPAIPRLSAERRRDPNRTSQAGG